MGRSVLLAVFALAACDQRPDAGTTPSGRDNRIDCRIGGAAQFERFCTVERETGADGPVLTVRKPDGGFRRLLVTGDGRGVAAADGAEPAHVTILRDNRIEVEIGGDRFRLPATVRRH